MDYVSWSDDFSVGVDALDKQHIVLLGLCKRAAQCLEMEGERLIEDFHEILGQLISYTENHFRDEERLLSANSYPKLAEHRAEHIEYSTRLTGFLLDVGNGIVDREGLFEYLTEWWTKHILCSDKAYMPFLKAQGAD